GPSAPSAGPATTRPPSSATPAAPRSPEIRRVGYGHPDALRLIDEVQAEYVVRYGGPDETPLDPLMFEPPTGSFFAGYLDGRPVCSSVSPAPVDQLPSTSTTRPPGTSRSTHRARAAGWSGSAHSTCRQRTTS